MSTITVAEFARKIQQLSNLPSPTEKEKMELRFYSEIIQRISEIDIENIVPLAGTYSVENAQQWAKSLGMHVVEGGSNKIYLSWTKGLND